jgi:hypothetical protein
MAIRKKLFIGLGIVLPLALVVPTVLLSSPMMDCYQRRIDRDPEAESSRWLQMTTADWCSRTWRPEMAATGYRRFYERYPGDIRRAFALLRYAQSLEEAGRNADARDIYAKYVTEYPDLEGAAEARIGINRIEKCRP